MRRIFRALVALVLITGLGCSGDTPTGVGPGSDADGAGQWLYDGGGGDGLPFKKCAAVTETAKNTYQPVDIVFAIDNSPSLLDEINATRANMNTFSKQISASGLDAHIVLISCLPGDCDNPKFHGICIDPPLGKTGGCTGPTYGDTNLPRYKHVSIKVPSTQGLSRIISTHPQWKTTMRAGAARHVVIISDDTDDWTAAQFNAELLKLDSGFKGYRFHGIFAFKSKEDACAIDKSQPCCKYAAPGGEGKPYRDLVKLTGGVSSDLCLQAFTPVFKAIATSVIKSAKLSCSWSLPKPPTGETLDPNKINVEFIDGSGASTVFGQVASAAECAKATGDAWYYDNPGKPTKVVVCPKTCTSIQSQTKAQIKIQFGCKTKLAPIE
jgi:hypothetical protein